MASPICTVNATSTVNGVNVSAGSLVTIALQSTAGADVWAIRCINTDDLHLATTITASMTVNYVTKTATFTAPADNAALIFESKVNNGVRNGIADSNLTTTFGVYTALTTAGRVVAANERNEGNAAFGWTSVLNNVARAVGGGGGSGLLTAVVNFTGSVGDGLVTANHASDVTRLALANAANTALGFVPTGIALTPPISGLPCLYAPPGTEVAAATIGLTADGTTSWAILNSSGRVTRKKNPTSSDVFIGCVNQQGNLLVMQTWFETSVVNVGLPPYSADTSGAVGTADAIRQAAIDADISGGAMQLNFASKEVRIPQGLLVVEKPIHILTEACSIKGEGRLTSHLRATTFIGPVLHIAPDVGVFPTVVNSGIGGGNAAVIKHEAQVQNEHWFEISECGAGGDYQGLGAISVEMIVTMSATTSTTGALLWASFGERLATDGVDNEAIGVGFQGSAGSISPNAFYFSLTTTVGGLTTIFATTGTSVVGTQYTVQCTYDGANMKIFIDGVQRATQAKTGTIVQGSWETVNFNGQYQYFLGNRKYSNADCLLASFRVSGVARTGAIAAAKFVEDANTICLINFDTFDGVFVKARARPTRTSTSCIDAYYPHRLDNVGLVGGMVDISVSDICITNLYGTAVNANSAFNLRCHNMTTFSKNGFRLDNNCFKAAISDLFITSTNNDATGSNGRVGISMVGAANVMSAGNIYVSGFDCNLILSGGGDVGTWGSWYSTLSKIHVFIFACININWTAESEISDEASVGTKQPDAFLAILATHASLWQNFQPSQGGSAGFAPLVVIQGDAVFGPGNHVFDTPWLKVSNSNTGIFQFLGTASTFCVALRWPFIFAAGTAPLIRPTPSIPVGVRMFITPRGDKEVKTLTMTDANRTVTAEEWLWFTTIVSGTLTATRTFTVPAANVGPRVIANTTTQILSVVAAGSAAPINLAAGKTGTYVSNGTDLTLIATT